VLFDQPGTFTATATLGGMTLGSMVVNVAYVDFAGPVACQVGYKREKGVEVYGPLDQIFFTSKNPNLEVSVKTNTSYGVRLYLKPTSRTEPVIVQARLGSINGPVLAEQRIDAFDIDYSPITHIGVPSVSVCERFLPGAGRPDRWPGQIPARAAAVVW